MKVDQKVDESLQGCKGGRQHQQPVMLWGFKLNVKRKQHRCQCHIERHYIPKALPKQSTGQFGRYVGHPFLGFLLLLIHFVTDHGRRNSQHHKRERNGACVEQAHLPLRCRQRRQHSADTKLWPNKRNRSESKTCSQHRD